MHGSMKLPNGARALVEDGKLLDYVLNPLHPVGRHHAALFAQLLGITRSNYMVLKNALLQAAREGIVQRGQASPFGEEYEMAVSVSGPRGTASVLAVWLVETGLDRPRLITCYPE
jgi:hypothetical protein